jgi:hypothetical protein
MSTRGERENDTTIAGGVSMKAIAAVLVLGASLALGAAGRAQANPVNDTGALAGEGPDMCDSLPNGSSTQAAEEPQCGGGGTFNPGGYTHGSCAGNYYSRIDPVNFVFWDWGTWDRAVNNIHAHAGWYDDGGSGQYFFDNGNCHFMTAQRASDGVSSTRFHIRLHPIYHDASYGWTTIGDAHHEDFVWHCGHAVDSNGPEGSGFDQGRRQLRILQEWGGHGWFSEWWGNTQNFQQCDGDYASSDGYTVFSHAHQGYH